MKLAIVMLFAISGLTLAACTDTTTTSSSYDRHVTIINNTKVAMREFYGSNAGAGSWEEDILGNAVLPAGSSVNINFDDGSGYCNFDFKAVFNDGSSLVDSNVDVCSTSTVEFH
jgi:hypothetical protein